MKKLERRIQALIKNRPGIRTSQIVEYLGMDPNKVINLLQDMKKKGALVGKPVKGHYIGISDKLEIRQQQE